MEAIVLCWNIRNIAILFAVEMQLLPAGKLLCTPAVYSTLSWQLSKTMWSTQKLSSAVFSPWQWKCNSALLNHQSVCYIKSAGSILFCGLPLPGLWQTADSLVIVKRKLVGGSGIHCTRNTDKHFLWGFGKTDEQIFILLPGRRNRKLFQIGFCMWSLHSRLHCVFRE